MQDEQKNVRACYVQFGATAPSQEALNEFCTRSGLEAVDVGSYSDFAYARKHDERMYSALPKLLALIATCKYVGETATPAEQKAAKEFNDAVVQEIRELLETSEIPYRLLDNVESYCGSLFELIKVAVRIINNKAGQCFQHLACEKFDTTELHAGHFAAYAKDVMTKAAEKNKAKAA